MKVEYRRVLKGAMLAIAFCLCTVAPHDRAESQAAVEHPLPINPATSKDSLIDSSKRSLAPDFTLTDSNDKPLQLSRYKGKVVLLNFWATWCGGCKYEMPWFIDFDKKYGSQGLAVVGVSMDDGMNVVKPFLISKGVPYPSVVGDEALGKRFGLESMPLSLLIDRQGRIAVAHQGVVDKNDFEMHLQQLLRN